MLGVIKSRKLEIKNGKWEWVPLYILYRAFPIIILFLMHGCNIDGKTAQNSPSSFRTVAWTATSPSQMDTGSGQVAGSLVVKEPDGDGTALAVWVEKTDLNPFDSYPAVYHLYTRWFSGGAWATTDTGVGSSGCPSDGQPENSDGDGICVIDTGSVEFPAWVPQVAMDNNGDAVVLWSQMACLVNANGGNCTDYDAGDRWVSNIYARRFTAGSWGSSPELIDSEDYEAVNPSLAVETGGGGTAMAVWEQWDSATSDWRLYARRFSAGVWATADSGCPFGDPDPTGNDGICLIDAGVGGNAHRPKVRMNNAGDAMVGFIQFADVTCYLPNTSKTTATVSFLCPHNRLFYRTFTSGTWDSATDLTPDGSLGSVTSCFDGLATTCTGDCTPPGEATGSMNCNTDAWGGDCNNNATGFVGTDTCRSFYDHSLAMGLTNLSSAAMVYKSMEWSHISDLAVTCTGNWDLCQTTSDGGCNCGCSAWGCGCQCEDPKAGTEVYQRISIQGWRNTGVDSFPSRPGLEGTTNTLAEFSYLGPSGTSNCSSTNISDADDFRQILNCDLRSPKAAVETDPADNDGGGPDDALTSIIVLYERSDGPSNPSRIYYNRFNGAAWTGSTLLAGLPTQPARNPQVIVRNTGDGLGVWVQLDASGKSRIYSSSFTLASGWGVAGTIDGDGVSVFEDNYYQPMVSMDDSGSALALFIGFSQNLGLSLYGVKDP